MLALTISGFLAFLQSAVFVVRIYFKQSIISRTTNHRRGKFIFRKIATRRSKGSEEFL